MKVLRIFSALVLASFLGTSALAQTVGMGTGKQGFFTYSAGSSIAKVVSDAGIQMRVQPFGGTSAYVPAINAGEVEFGLANHLETALAIEGKGMYEGKPNPKLRAIAVLVPMRAGFFVRKDSDIKSIKDLKGKRVPAEFSSQRIIQVLIKAVLANGGLTYDDVQKVKVANVGREADDFAAGRVDVFMFALGAAKVAETDAKVGGIRTLGIDPSPEAVKRMRAIVPVSYAFLQKPAKKFTGVLKPTYLMAYDYLALANADVPDDLVYKVTRAMYEHTDEVVSGFRALEGFSKKTMVKDLGVVKYHPGAIRLYKEVGLWPPKQ